MQVLSKLGGTRPASNGNDLDIHLLLNALPAAAYTCDAEGLITYYNQRAVQAWGREPKLNDPADRYCGSFRMTTPEGSEVPHEQCWMALCLHEKKEYHGREIVVERPDGTRLIVEAHATPWFDKQGTLIGAVNIVVDVTEKKRADDQLRRSERALQESHRRKDEFLATLAHELRNPLAPISNAVELLRLQNTADTQLEEARDIIERQVRQLSRLVDDLLDMSRVTSGKISLQKKPVSLATIVTDAVESSRPLIEASLHTLTVTLPPGPVFLDGDAIRLVQVFSNLLTNAAKYTERGGHIWLTAERQNGEVMVSVVDTGIGIDAAHLPHIFEMFSQVAPSLERSQGGLGIGLSLVRGLVDLHGGSIEARSAGIGMGSEFIVRLPATESTGPTVHKTNGVKQASDSQRTCRILVVDDNRDAAKSLTMLLRAMGHETHTSHDGLEAIQAAATFRPEVALLDIGLPGMDGYEVARHIRQRAWGKRMVLAALTGWGQEEDKRRSMVAGFDHHLTKPVDPVALRTLLASRPEADPRPIAKARQSQAGPLSKEH